MVRGTGDPDSRFIPIRVRSCRGAPTIDISYVLDKIYDGARDQRAKGDGFERLVRRFLLTEAVHANRFDSAWMWSDWPDGGYRPGRGIEVVVRERDTGDLVAVQCKFYDPAHTLPSRHRLVPVGVRPGSIPVAPELMLRRALVL